MSSYNNCYLPQPPRAWSRVQNSCSLITTIDNDGLTKVPLTGEIVPASILDVKMAMLNKGNVLQYKANSSNLTKVQKYSKIAKGQWVNRNTTWATQSTRGYTNPNTTSLKRSGNVVNIAVDPITGAVIGPTTAPVTCPQIINPSNPVLPLTVPDSDTTTIVPDIPLPVNPSPGSDIFPPIISVTPVPPLVIQDEGVLICSIQENVCTGETKTSISQQLCNFTSDSDVPGPIQELCWNDGTPTWYPRQRYTMSNSGNKWPTNYKGLVSAIKPNPPVLAVIVDNELYIELSWTENYCSGYTITSFNIYVNNRLLKNIPNNKLYTIKINNLTNVTNYIYITSLLGHIESLPSNIITTSSKPDGILTENTVNNINIVDISKPQVITDIVKYYNNLLQDNAIIPINTYLINYNNNFNNPDDNTYITADEYNNINSKLHKLSLKGTDRNSLVINDIINTYKSIFKSLYFSFNSKKQLKDTQLSLTQYKGDSTILRTPDLLEEFIKILLEARNKMMDIMGITIEAPMVIFGEEYLIYNDKYGIPQNYIYEPDLLEQIRKTLSNNQLK